MLSHDDSNKYVTDELSIKIRIPALFLFQNKNTAKEKHVKIL